MSVGTGVMPFGEGEVVWWCCSCTSTGPTTHFRIGLYFTLTPTALSLRSGSNCQSKFGSCSESRRLLRFERLVVELAVRIEGRESEIAIRLPLDVEAVGLALALSNPCNTDVVHAGQSVRSRYLVVVIMSYHSTQRSAESFS